MNNSEYTKGIRDMWESIKEFKRDLLTDDNGLRNDDIRKKYGLIFLLSESLEEAFYKTDPERIVESVKQFNQTIHVGDEVIVDKDDSFEGAVFIVTKISEIGLDDVWGVSRKGQTYHTKKTSLTKTGKRFPELIEVIDEIKKGKTNDTF